MTAPTITLAAIGRFGPCKDRYKALYRRLPEDEPITAAVAIAAGATLDDVIWVADRMARTDDDVRRRLRLWLADCAAHVLHLYEQEGASDAPRRAIVAARRYARGEIDASAMEDARRAKFSGDGAISDEAHAAAGAAMFASSWSAYWRAITAAGETAAGEAERQWQLDRLVAWLSDPEPEDWPLPEWAAHDREARDAG